jgi:cell division protein FtsI/penicillin-binding protein 2
MGAGVLTRETKMNAIKVIFALAMIILVLGVVGRMDMEDEQYEQEAYCNMRSVWEEDAARGVKLEDRNGWPAFKPELDGLCKW